MLEFLWLLQAILLLIIIGVEIAGTIIMTKDTIMMERGGAALRILIIAMMITPGPRDILTLREIIPKETT